MRGRSGAIHRQAAAAAQALALHGLDLFYEVRPKVNVDKEIVKFINQNKGKAGII